MCSAFIEPEVLALDVTSLQGETAARRWVDSRFGREGSNAQWNRHTDGRLTMQWTTKSKREYVISFAPTEVGESVAVFWMDMPPRVSDLFSCLGAPTGYSALYRLQPDGVYTVLEFVYPERGVQFGVFLRGKLKVGSGAKVQAIGISARAAGLSSWNDRLLALNVGRRVGLRDSTVLAFKTFPGDLENLEYIDTTASSP